jgi:hypothetical protein
MKIRKVGLDHLQHFSLILVLSFQGFVFSNLLLGLDVADETLQDRLYAHMFTSEIRSLLWIGEDASFRKLSFDF